MKKTLMSQLLIIAGNLLIFSIGFSSGVQYQAFHGELNYTEAHKACQGNDFKYLARIESLEELRLAKMSSSYNQTNKYWTGLQIFEESGYEEWRWSDELEYTLGSSLSQILDTNAVMDLVIRGPIQEYCFLINASDQLEIKNCSEKYPYMCERFKGKVTDTANIMASKTLSVSTQVSTSSLPTVPTSAEKQTAVNETSKLLAQFQNSSYPKTSVNLLLACQQLEAFAKKYAMKHLPGNGTFYYIAKHIVIDARTVSAGHKEDVALPSKDNQESLFANTKEGIVLPAELFEKQETFVVGIFYKNMHKLLPDESQYYLDGKELTNAKLQTRVIACSIYPTPSAALPQNVTISFTLEEPPKADDKPYCVFWDFNITSRFNGSWSNRGCVLVNKTNNNIVCSCNHLTNFAVLMQVGNNDVSAGHGLALKVITYIGCGLSLGGETLTVLAYVFLMNIKQEQCQIRLNLVIAIAVAQIIFLAGIDATSKQEVCIFVAVSIHYFYLAGFAWMLIEGIYLYLKVVQVFHALVKIELFYAFSWGLPFLIAGCSIVIAYSTGDGITSYLNSESCWVSFRNNLVWTFAAPVLVICLVNSLIFCRAVYKMTNRQSNRDVSLIKEGLKACAVLFPLLGLTWVFGVLTVTDAGLVFQYIFTILNSLQGFFIFIMHVLQSNDIRTAYLQKKHKWQNAKNTNFQNSRLVMENVTTVLENEATNNLQGNKDTPDPMFRRHQVSPSQ